jgi:PPP family 3-phenylpropionic acid transporter
MPRPRRLGLYQAPLFVGAGAGSPYAPVWFAGGGLSGAQIGIILPAPCGSIA